VTASTYLPNYGGGMPARMPNGNCYEFTAISQPGTRYRRAPGGCCFTPDTQVLDGAGNGVALRDVKRGDTVLTTVRSQQLTSLRRASAFTCEPSDPAVLLLTAAQVTTLPVTASDAPEQP
jgi:hypothetical protein